MTETYCFVCGELICYPEVAVLQGRKVSLKWLFIRICEILNICPEEEWDFLVNCENTQCCSNCYQQFKLIWETHQSLLQIQKNLQKYVRQVEQSVQQSGGITQRFHPKCTQFRQQFANCVNDPRWMIPQQTNQPPRIHESLNIGPEIRSFGLKTESEFIVTNDPLESLEEGDSSALPYRDYQKKDLLKSEATVDIDIVENALAQELSHDNNTLQSLTDPLLEESGPEFADSWQDDESEEERSQKQDFQKLKRKFKVIAEEDECQQELTEDSPTKEKKSPSKKRRKLKYPRNSDCGELIKCTYEGCSYATKDTRNSRRHAQSHIPMDQRTDFVSCPACDKKLTKDGLSKHIRQHHRPDLLEDGLTCPDCGKKFLAGHKSRYQQHLKVHREKPFICDICSNGFITEPALNSHIREIHQDYDIKCQYCDKTYTKRFSYRTHLRRRHPGKPSQFFRRSTIPGVATDKASTSGKILKCKHEGCLYTSQWPNNFARHAASHLSIAQRTDIVACPHCERKVTKDSLPGHIRRLHRPDLLENGPTCPDCGKKFPPGRNSEFQLHLKIHSKERPFPCHVCGKRFTTKTNLDLHNRAVHESVDINLKCDLCDKSFTKKASFKKHWRDHHSDKPYPSHLVQCVAYTHPPPKPPPTEVLYKCSHDGCTFATPHKNNLRRHGYTHLPPEERPDMGQCSDCGIRLEMLSLKRHIKLCHSDVESIPFVICPECGRKFLAEDKSLFENHMKEHRGEKDFICEECGKGFVTQGHLSNHIKSAHETLDIDCEQCGKKFTKRPAYSSHWKRHHSQLPFPLRNPNRKKVDKTLNKFNNYLEIERKAKEMMPVRKWPCEWDNCDVVCVAKYTLDRHVLRVHHGVDVHAKWKKKKDDQPGCSLEIKPEIQSLK